mgnify:CR=1 FL=1
MPKPQTYKWRGWAPGAEVEQFAEKVRGELWTVYPNCEGVNSEFFDFADAVSRLRGDLLEEDRKDARKVTITVTIE